MKYIKAIYIYFIKIKNKLFSKFKSDYFYDRIFYFDIQITILYAIYNTIITYKIQNINFSHELM